VATTAPQTSEDSFAEEIQKITSMDWDDVSTMPPASSAGSTPTTSQSSLPPRSELSSSLSQDSQESSKTCVPEVFNDGEADAEVLGVAKKAEMDNGSDRGSDCESEDSDIAHTIADIELEAAKMQEPRQADKPNERTLFDKCTLRTWFMGIDTSGDGVISRNEFTNWLVRNPHLRQILLEGENDPSSRLDDSMPETEKVARISRRVLRYFREMDLDRNRCIDFKEFVTLFHRAGYLLEYGSSNNPRNHAEKILKVASQEGPVDVRAASQRARRTSECLWSLNQKQITKAEMLKDHEMLNQRRRTTVGPASFWDENAAVMVCDGGRQRRRSWGGSTH
jgi:Ca2+-binding EF-hand superfamily protein